MAYINLAQIDALSVAAEIYLLLGKGSERNGEENLRFDELLKVVQLGLDSLKQAQGNPFDEEEPVRVFVDPGNLVRC